MVKTRPLGGLALGGLDMWTNQLFGFSFFGTMKHDKTDAEATGKAADFRPIDYPRPDGVLSFDRLTNVAYSATNHDENQPAHLQLARMPRFRSATTCRNMPDRRSVTARPGFMKSSRTTAGNANSRSISRTACTARPVTSRIRPRTSTGRCRKVVKGRITRICKAVHRQFDPETSMYTSA